MQCVPALHLLKRLKEIETTCVDEMPTLIWLSVANLRPMYRLKGIEIT